MYCISPMKRAAWIAGAALVLGALVPVSASARCVRDVAESGAVGVRCSDGVRGHLASDNVAPPSPSVSTRSGSSALGTRGNNSALSGGGAPASALSSGAASNAQRSPYGGGRPGDTSGGMYSISRGADSGTSGDRRPY
jgi:hypothetical protein